MASSHPMDDHALATSSTKGLSPSYSTAQWRCRVVSSGAGSSRSMSRTFLSTSSHLDNRQSSTFGATIFRRAAKFGRMSREEHGNKGREGLGARRERFSLDRHI